MAGAPETSPAAVPPSGIDDHDPRLAGGESDLDLWGGWPDDELAAPQLIPEDRPTRLTGTQGGRVSKG